MSTNRRRRRGAGRAESPAESAALEQAITGCMSADQPRLRRLAAELAKAGGADRAARLKRLERALAESGERRRQRAARVPAIEFPAALSISAACAEISAALAEHPVIVVCGETGSGKTTQLPKICLAAGRGVGGQIGHTQPRRIAARSVATRIAEELGGVPGEAVGFKIRFSDRTRPEGLVKVMTDGILLAETQGDPELRAYDTLIIDEAHERSLNIDFLLGYLKRLLPRRPDLKLVITSATIDPERFARHFDGAPVIEVSGRGYPIEVRYRPLAGEDEDEQDRDREQAILEAIDELSGIDRRGDVLVFLPGEREIRETAESLRKHHPAGSEILPLYARLSAAQQQRVFQPHRRQRIVLATNVAETSLTVPGIRFVVDPGEARIRRYSHRTKVQRLHVERISQASAEQRSGRCGRTSAGVCIRLYSEEDFARRPRFTEPEILRSNLAGVILQMKHLGLGAIEDFPFLEPPDPRYVRDGLRLLEELGALDVDGALTEVGLALARLPVDPRIGRMLLEASRRGALTEVLVIAAGLSVRDPRERPADARQQADEAHADYLDERSDFRGLLNLWRFFEERRARLSQNQLRKLCRQRFLSYVRMREWREIHQQLHHLATDLGMKPNRSAAGYAEIHQSILAGLLGNIGFRDERDSYQGARGNRLWLWPGSTNHGKPPKWIMAAELVDTSRLFARMSASIEPAWVEDLAGGLVKRRYFDPHWRKRPARVGGYEQVTLYGLTLAARRGIDYGRVDPAAAREIFIRHALVRGEYASRAPFFVRNRALVGEIEEIEHRLRRRDLLADEQALFEFYERRVPEHVHSGASFERWRREAERGDPELLVLSREELLRARPGNLGEAFPDQLQVGALTLPLQYRFDPAHEADGVTVTVPAAALAQLDAEALEWLVPGLLREKLIALIKSLPKALRRHFVPAPEFADACLAAWGGRKGSLHEALGAELRRMTGVTVPRETWRAEALPAHLVMGVRVIGAGGEEIARGRDLAELRRTVDAEPLAALAPAAGGGLQRERIERWDFGDLPDCVELEQHGLKLRGFPALVALEDGVALQTLDSAARARVAHRGGVRALIRRTLAAQVKYLRRNLPDLERMALHFAAVGSARDLERDLVEAIIDRAFLGEGPAPRDEAGFLACLERGRAALMEVAEEFCAAVADALGRHHAARKRLRAAGSPALLGALQEADVHLQGLVYPGFVLATPWEWLRHYPRYLRAVELRLEKLAGNLERDRAARSLLAELAEPWAREAGRAELEGRSDPELVRYRWLLEELRVSLFAQQLGTAVPVSAERLRRQWQKVGR